MIVYILMACDTYYPDIDNTVGVFQYYDQAKVAKDAIQDDPNHTYNKDRVEIHEHTIQEWEDGDGKW